LRRLFSTFARGWPGLGLLLIRLVVGISLVVNGIQKFPTGQLSEQAILNLVVIGDGALLIVGLWTPVTGALVSVLAVWGFLIQNSSLGTSALPATVGLGLALVGPGAWSLDARLFGWKRIDIDR
jgi:putative oxidoreductase